MIKTRIISSLEKCFLDQKIEDFEACPSLCVLQNERVSFQLAYQTDEVCRYPLWLNVKVSGKLARRVTLRMVESIPSVFPAYPTNEDGNYLRKTQGLYPDLLATLRNGNRVPVTFGELRAVWVTLEGKLPKGNSFLTVSLVDGDGNERSKSKIKICVIGAKMPEQTLVNTQWFHSDCLADYYDCKVFSAKWWKIVENFVKTAVRNGQNALLTPIFTPPLDTQVGGERPTVQLVDVQKIGNSYRFSYEKLDKWLAMCDKLGVKYYEISHFFTQWGAAHSPKIMATENGETKRIFGWDTDASGEAYSAFLRAFIPDFLAHMKAKGKDEQCLFHISDEPHVEHLEQYGKSKAVVTDLLQGYTVMDALSNLEFYEQGVAATPIPSTNRIQPFIDAGVPNLWAYYCCGQDTGTSNRFFAMPSWRNRAIGFQLFKYDIVGFLHWGYNFYYSQYAIEYVDPYLDSSGKYFTPSGDCYSVYPAPDGTAYESLRLVVFYEALQDMRAAQLCAQYIGKEATVALLEKHLGEIRFDICPYSAAPLLQARAALNDVIARYAK